MQFPLPNKSTELDPSISSQDLLWICGSVQVSFSLQACMKPSRFFYFVAGLTVFSWSCCIALPGPLPKRNAQEVLVAVLAHQITLYDFSTNYAFLVDLGSADLHRLTEMCGSRFHVFNSAEQIASAPNSSSLKGPIRLKVYHVKFRGSRCDARLFGEDDISWWEDDYQLTRTKDRWVVGGTTQRFRT